MRDKKDDIRAIRVIIEGELNSYIKVLKEGEEDKKNLAEYISKVYLKIGQICQNYNFDTKLFLNIFLNDFVNRYDPRLRKAFTGLGQSWGEDTERTIRKNPNWKFFQLGFFIILYKLIHHYLHLQFALVFLEV